MDTANWLSRQEEPDLDSLVPRIERARLVRHWTLVWFVALVACGAIPARTGTEMTATRSLTVQPSGPRQGEAGRRYFNLEGAKNDRYASFGVLVFQLPKGEDDIEKLSLRLVQSIPTFAEDAKARSWLAEPSAQGTDGLAGLKLDPMPADEIGKDAFKADHPLGSGTCITVEN